uniref:Putative secreted protein n=1 Tax=Anopheles darlingi TaxID=43151 RepID=A0A2M4D7I8_ANODA
MTFRVPRLLLQQLLLLLICQGILFRWSSNTTFLDRTGWIENPFRCVRITIETGRERIACSSSTAATSRGQYMHRIGRML